MESHQEQLAANPKISVNEAQHVATDDHQQESTEESNPSNKSPEEVEAEDNWRKTLNDKQTVQLSGVSRKEYRRALRKTCADTLSGNTCRTPYECHLVQNYLSCEACNPIVQVQTFLLPILRHKRATDKT